MSAKVPPWAKCPQWTKLVRMSETFEMRVASLVHDRILEQFRVSAKVTSGIGARAALLDIEGEGIAPVLVTIFADGSMDLEVAERFVLRDVELSEDVRVAAEGAIQLLQSSAGADGWCEVRKCKYLGALSPRWWGSPSGAPTAARVLVTKRWETWPRRS